MRSNPVHTVLLQLCLNLKILPLVLDSFHELLKPRLATYVFYKETDSPKSE